MWELAVPVAISVLVVLIIGIFLAKLYRRSTRDEAYVRTGLGGQKVVRLARRFRGFFHVRDRLDRRRVEGQDHHLHPVLVHLGQPVVLHVEQALFQLGPDMVAEEPLRVVEGVGDCEMLFQADLAIHVGLRAK